MSTRAIGLALAATEAVVAIGFFLLALWSGRPGYVLVAALFAVITVLHVIALRRDERR
jgi:hypothetical protein